MSLTCRTRSALTRVESAGLDIHLSVGIYDTVSTANKGAVVDRHLGISEVDDRVDIDIAERAVSNVHLVGCRASLIG